MCAARRANARNLAAARGHNISPDYVNEGSDDEDRGSTLSQSFLRQEATLAATNRFASAMMAAASAIVNDVGLNTTAPPLLSVGTSSSVKPLNSNTRPGRSSALKAEDPASFGTSSRVARALASVNGNASPARTPQRPPSPPQRVDGLNLNIHGNGNSGGGVNGAYLGLNGSNSYLSGGSGLLPVNNVQPPLSPPGRRQSRRGYVALCALVAATVYALYMGVSFLQIQGGGNSHITVLPLNGDDMDDTEISVTGHKLDPRQHDSSAASVFSLAHHLFFSENGNADANSKKMSMQEHVEPQPSLAPDAAERLLDVLKDSSDNTNNSSSGGNDNGTDADADGNDVSKENKPSAVSSRDQDGTDMQSSSQHSTTTEPLNGNTGGALRGGATASHPVKRPPASHQSHANGATSAHGNGDNSTMSQKGRHGGQAASTSTSNRPHQGNMGGDEDHRSIAAIIALAQQRLAAARPLFVTIAQEVAAAASSNGAAIPNEPAAVAASAVSASPTPGPVVVDTPESPEIAQERIRLQGGRPVSPWGRPDIQILRDLAPWRERGITLEDITATRAHAAPLIDHVNNFSSGMITTYIRRGVPYYLESEVRGPLSLEYGIGSKGKIRAVIEMLAALNRVFPLPDVAFIWNVHPWPLLRTGGGSNNDHSLVRHSSAHAPQKLAPVFSLCKTEGDLDVLYPNMYFQSPKYWWRATRSLERASRNWPWSRRRTRMWWRGASGWMWPAAAPRVLTLAKWHDRPWADLAFTNPWPAQLKDWARTKEPFLAQLPRRVKKIPHGAEMRTTMEAVAKYKYALHLPGSYGATYSRTLQFLVWTGSTVFFYDCPYYEFYYHHLAPWKHYVPVNLTNLGDRVAWAQANPAKAAAIAAAAQKFAMTHLTAGHVALYWKHLLDEYASLQRFKLRLPDDACTCWPLRGQTQAASRPSHIPRGTKRCKWVCDFVS